MESPFAVVPGVQVEDLGGIAGSKTGYPRLVQRITAEEIVTRGVERAEIAPSAFGFQLS